MWKVPAPWLSRARPSSPSLPASRRTRPSPLVGAHVSGYDASLDVSVTATGTAATSVALTDTATITGGTAPGRYVINVVQTVTNGQLLITSWTLHPA